jgi:pyruvate formate lyase activating enzyme
MAGRRGIDSDTMAKTSEQTKIVRGRVFEIERYAINDGPGIRTLVFLKGCSLRCVWCCNPESQIPRTQLVYWKSRCLSCSHCIEACEADALTMTPEGIVIDRDRCTVCGACAEVCYAEALVLVGKEMTPEEVLEEVLKDELFYRKSGGGVTFSGGEPFEQSAFVLRTAELCKAHGIPTAVETCGAVPWKTLESSLPLIDLFLYDLKILDSARHERCTGVSNDRILDNFKRLVAAGKQMRVRVPIIPGRNDSDGDLGALVEFLKATAPGIPVDLLPYHRLGRSKYDRLGVGYSLDELEPPSPERMASIKRRFEDGGFPVTIGG